MKRLLLWLPIIITPTLLSFAVTHNGHAAARATPITPPETAIVPIPGRRIILIPAHPPPTQPALRVRLMGAVGLAVRVTDPNGRRSGTELDSHLVLQEIPHSRVRSLLAARDGATQQEETILITVAPAESTIYTITVSGRQSGPYHLDVGGVSPTLQSIRTMDNGRVPEDTSLHYQVNLKNIVPLSPWEPMTAYRAPDAAHAFFLETGQSVIEPIDPPSIAAAAAIDRDPCGYFFRELKVIALGLITRRQGELNSVFDNSRFPGCQVTLYAPDSRALFKMVQDFGGYEGTTLYHLGWRQSRTIDAGGYGSGELGIEDRSRLCVVSTGTPENTVNYTGPSLPDHWLIVTVQCRHKGPG